MDARQGTHAAQLAARVPTFSLPLMDEETVGAAAEAVAAEDEAAVLIVNHHHLDLAIPLGLLLDRPRMKSQKMMDMMISLMHKT